MPESTCKYESRPTNHEPREYWWFIRHQRPRQASWLTPFGIIRPAAPRAGGPGIAVNNKGVLSPHKEMGLVNDVFNEKDIVHA